MFLITGHTTPGEVNESPKKMKHAETGGVVERIDIKGSSEDSPIKEFNHSNFSIAAAAAGNIGHQQKQNKKSQVSIFFANWYISLSKFVNLT